MTREEAKGNLIHAIRWNDMPKKEAVEMAIKALEQTSWIPVTEKLPDKKDYCLCCDKDGYITIGFISQWSKEWCFDDPEIDIDVVAWMPLPPCYEQQESEG